MILRLHGSAVVVAGRGVLLLGPSGSGKSDLALRLIDRGAGLIADDQIMLRVRSGILIAAAPAAGAGLIEIRGLGIARLPAHKDIPVMLAITLGETPARLPAAETVEIAGIALQHLRLDGAQPSAPLIVELALNGDILAID